jgi:GGDEF domain-containing protein
MALIRGKDYVSPLDIAEVVNDVLRHRIILNYKAEASGVTTDDVMDEKFAELITTTVKFNNQFTGLGIGIDRTQEKLLEKKYFEVYFYDELTGLPNRKAFLMRLRKAINYAQKNNHSIAIILLDIKNFKLINEKYGFKLGDKLLQQRMEEHL